MKTLRKSLNGHKDQSQHISTPLPSLSKPSSAIQPPKKVIRALDSYKSTAPQELSFEKGDFFHVLSDLNKQGVWYEAHNPMTGARGLVPCDMFEEFHKGAATPRPPSTSNFKGGAANGSAATTDRARSGSSAKPQAYYAIVLHDFVAERADELDAKQGDSITVVAQSNREWFVAKPIGRLGRPGLVPVSFVEVRDPATGRPVEDVMALIDGGALPRVEEWKRAMMNYKANSINLGVLDDSTAANVVRNPSRTPAVPPVPPASSVSSQYVEREKPLPPDIPRPASPKLLPEGILLSADVNSFHYEMDEYWFRVHAIYQPYDPSGTDNLPPAKQLVLFRSYNDFYDFQIDLLHAFPIEAGDSDPNSRILPYMPGPVSQVDTEVTNTRRAELDDYLHRLCDLQQYARYILEHTLVRTFLGLKSGDAEGDIEPRLQEIAALDQMAQQTEEQYDQNGVDPYHEAERLARLQISEQGEIIEEGYGYDETDGFGDSYGVDSYGHRYHQSTSSRLSTDPQWATTQPLRPRSRTTTGHERAQNGASVYTHSSQTSAPGLQSEYYQMNGQSCSSVASSHDHHPSSGRVSQAGSTATSRTSLSGRTRSQSNANYNPPISATNPQIAFLKIKIFAPSAEDIVALRVHPNITHAQLLEKASEKLKLDSPVSTLRFRDSVNNDFVDLMCDEDLRIWLDTTDKYVLYAG
ncbi:uncharacterized protein LAESUDRAFT_639208 [Laetiporus sulphureus 93-53]|uniref:Uncharacterized protein n=1 Tax=Laetiporus sulphureus 93-53 TaxID=1314785 RepID=A0A165IIZ5_9APHY|nr:uncharacterized protein LAESUDRAFT_639208 [Laetiporus sulphureus 93-53]KZT13143.1 hypothetical protein LAESUDRAFT_639208 [Laetiporus sulphureus 93-53]